MSPITNLAFSAAVLDGSGILMDEENNVRVVNRAYVNATSTGLTQVVSSQTSMRVRVLAAVFVGDATVNVKFLSAGSDISPTFPIASNGGAVLPYNPHGWFQTNTDAALNIWLSTTANVGGLITWTQAL